MAEKWVEIAKEMLQLPSKSLKTAHWEVQLAYWYSRTGNKEKAIDHAMHAYQSRSTESYDALIAIYTKFGDYADANKIYEGLAGHYKYKSQHWLKWCLCHNKGDAKKARQVTITYFESLGVPAPNAHLESIFIYYLMVDEPKKAFAILKAMPDYKRARPEILLSGACLADQLGKKTDRDQLIQVVIDWEKDKRKSKNYAVLITYAKRLKVFLKRPDEKQLSLNVVNGLLGNSNNVTFQHVYLTTGYFLLANNYQHEAKPFIHLSALLLDDFPNYVNVIARQVLRKQGLTVGPLNEGISRDGFDGK